MKTNHPPRWAALMLIWLCSTHLLEEIQGDLHERFLRDVEVYGKAAADRQYVLNVLGFIRLKFGFGHAGWSSDLKQKSYSKPLYSDMLKNYFKTAVRNLGRNMTTSTVSILGLSVGLTAGLVIFLLVGYLFSFNRYHSKADRIYWIVTDIVQGQTQQTDVTPRPMGDVLRREYPFVESAVRLNNLFGKIITVPDGKGGITKKFEESRNICFTEPEYFDVFDSKWITGSPKEALAAPNKVVLSRDYAKKYFGSEKVMGKTLRFDNKTELTVSGIVENPPSNTQLRYDVLISYATIPGVYGDPDMLNVWAEPSTMCWVALKEGVSVSQLTNSFAQITKKFYRPEDAKAYNFRAIPLSEMFHAPGYGAAPRPILYALIGVGLFLVLAACVNFINLSTAQAIKRSREVGVRKTMGSTRRQLIGQFMLETAILCLGAFIIAMVFTQLSLPMLNEALWMLRANISVLDLLNPNALKWFGTLVTGVIILAGLYPAAILARLNPVTALKGRLTTQKAGKVSMRKSLVVVQFFITQLFIIAVVVISAQVKYLKTADLGFNKDAILMVRIPPENALKQQTLRSQLAEINGVEQVALAAEPPISGMQNREPFFFDHRSEKEKFTTRVRIGDKNFVPVFGLKIVAGRNFESDDSSKNEVLVNEKMLQQLGIRSPDEILGKSMRLWGQEKMIIGVVKDFNLDALSMGIQPAAIINDHSANTMAAVKIASENVAQTLKQIEHTWNNRYPESVYHASFLDEQIQEFYVTEQILLGLIQVFSVIAILIGCLGLYGLVTFMAESRSKEIGVRKVLGATKNQLLWIFGREFGKLMVLGFILAAPLGWFLMKNWLQGYAYKINLGIWIFAVSAGLTAVITLSTIAFQSIRAARMNPVRSLRND